MIDEQSGPAWTKSYHIPEELLILLSLSFDQLTGYTLIFMIWFVLGEFWIEEIELRKW